MTIIELPTTTDVSNRITSTPGVCGGKPCIAGHRIRVLDIYVMHGLQHQSIKEILNAYPVLTHEDVEAGIEYYKKYLLEVEQSYREEDAIVEEYKKQLGVEKQHLCHDE